MMASDPILPSPYAPIRRSLWAVALACALVACGAKSDDKPPPPPTRADFVGVWRVVFDSPGGALPVTVEIFSDAQPGPGGAAAVFRNGDHVAAFSEMSIVERRINLRVEHRDAAITAELDKSKTKLVGTWQVIEQDGPATLPVVAYKGQTHRFPDSLGGATGAAEKVPSVAGTWRLTFRIDGAQQGIAEFKKNGDTVTGGVIHPLGSLRHLTGRYKNGVLQLSSFTGAVATLMRARARPDGSLSGEIWFNDKGYLAFSGTPSNAEEGRSLLPDPTQLVRVLEPRQPVSFRFPDVDGKVLSYDDPRFEDKVVLIELFGSWCANCNDAAPHLVDWYKRYRERGLEVVGLAFEHTGDVERDRRQVQLYAKHHKIDFPLLLAGTSDLQQPLPDLSQVPVYPTLLFVGRDGLVKKIHSGFLGPSAGLHYERQIAEMQADIEALLDASEP